MNLPTLATQGPMRWPASIPAGIVTWSVRSSVTRPSPWHSVQGTAMVVPALDGLGRHVIGAPLLVLDPCGHVPYVERPQSLFAEVEAFLERNDAPLHWVDLDGDLTLRSIPQADRTDRERARGVPETVQHAVSCRCVMPRILAGFLAPER